MIRAVLVIHDDDVLQRRRYSIHLVMMCVCMYICVRSHDKMKTPDWNDWKLGTVVVLDSLSKHIDFGIKKLSTVRPVDQKLSEC